MVSCNFPIGFKYLLGGKELQLFFHGCSPLVWLTSTCLLSLSFYMCSSSICSASCICFSICSSAFYMLSSSVMPRGLHSSVRVPSPFWCCGKQSWRKVSSVLLSSAASGYRDQSFWIFLLPSCSKTLLILCKW